MAVMVLGTALTALGPAPRLEARTPPATVRAVNDMSRYCTTCWRNARLPVDCWADCTQEVFGRLLERVPAEAWDRVLQNEGEERREFVRAIDTVKKRTQRSRKSFSAGLEVVADPRDVGSRELADQREAVRRASEEVLSPRQQRILQLSGEGWTVPDIAKELQIRVERVSDEKYKAIRRLQAVLVSQEEDTPTTSALPA
jgi:RNA polymerase sigma factor (sigma-70 family)